MRAVPEQYREFMTKKRRQMFENFAVSMVAGMLEVERPSLTCPRSVNVLLATALSSAQWLNSFFPINVGYVVSNACFFVQHGFELQAETLFATAKSLLICIVVSLVIILMA